VWWYKAVLPAIMRLRQEDGKFKFSLDYLTRTKKKKEKKPY
jgi:hypothetical protein